MPGWSDLRHRPLDAVLLEAVVADAVPVRREVGELVPDRLGVRVLGPVRAERPRHVDDDLAVDPRLAGQRHRRADAADAPLGVRERAVLLGEARRREARRPRTSRVMSLRKMSCETRKSSTAEPLLDVVRVRLGLRRVLADEVERLDAAVVEAAHHLVEAVARRLGHLDAPRLGELPPDLGVVDGLVAREVRRGSRPSRSGPGRCSGRGARSGRSTRSRGGRS